MQVHVAQHDADRTALWGSLLVWIDLAIFQDACFQPAPDQADHARIADAVLHEAEHPFVTETPEVGSQVKVEDARLPLDNCLGYSLDRVMCCPLGPISKRSRLEIRL